MALSKVFFAIFCFCLFAACSGERFDTIDVVANTDSPDSLQIFYRHSLLKNYSEKQSENQWIAQADTVRFLPEPTKGIWSLRIDLGDALNERRFTICAVRFEQNGNSRWVSGDSLAYFFEGNDQVRFNEVAKCFELRSEMPHDPYIVSKNLRKVF